MEKKTLRTQTKYFGEITYEEENVLHFPRGLFGFESEDRFLLLPFEGDGGLYSLQSLKTPRLAFVAVEPAALLPEYEPVLQPEDWKLLGAPAGEKLYFYALCAVKDPVSKSTVNLRCPVAIYEKGQRAAQVILEDGRYGMRHFLSDLTRQEGEVC